MNRSEIASFLCVLPDTISDWVRRLNDGLSGIGDKHRSGAPSRLAKEKEESFVNDVLSLQTERSGGSITAWDIQELLSEKYQVNYKRDSIYPLLKRVGLSWITSRSKHPKSDEEQQENFKKNFS